MTLAKVVILNEVKDLELSEPLRFTHYHSPPPLCYQNHLCLSYLKHRFEA